MNKQTTTIIIIIIIIIIKRFQATFILYRIFFGADTRSYPVEYEQQRYRTGTSRSQTLCRSGWPRGFGELISVRLVSLGSLSKVKKLKQWFLTRKTLLCTDCTCMMVHAFKSDFCAVAAQLRHKISRWELFFEAVNKRQQIKFFYISKGAFLWDDPNQDQ